MFLEKTGTDEFMMERVKSMFQVNDMIVYGTHGVCKVQEIVSRDFGKEMKDYYLLKPVYDSGATIFVPVDNEKLQAKMRRVLSEEEVRRMIHGMPDEQLIWIENDNARKEAYKQIMDKGDRAQLIQLVKTLYFHSKKQKEKGKRLHVSDEVFLREAEMILYEEIALVLHMDKEEVRPYIIKELAEEKD